MYAEIHSKSENNDESSGKTMWVNSDALDIQIDATSPKHLKSPPWHIVVKAEMTEEKSSGARSPWSPLGGETYRAVNRTLEIQLTPDDLSALLNFGLTNGLLSLTTKR